jgi:hypothetical protein
VVVVVVVLGVDAAHMTLRGLKSKGLGEGGSNRAILGEFGLE